jgi:hypothetical protein
MALEIETLRILIIEQLVFLAAQIATDIAAAPVTFGESATLIAQRCSRPERWSRC